MRIAVPISRTHEIGLTVTLDPQRPRRAYVLDGVAVVATLLAVVYRLAQ